MKGTPIFAILLSILITVFALSNNQHVDINYLVNSVRLPLSLVIIISMAIGILIMFLLNIPTWWKHRNEKAVFKKQIASLEKELSAANQKVAQLQVGKATKQDDFLNDVEKE